MNHLSFLGIKAVATVAETGGFRKSDLRLGLGQPAISCRVARVEEMSGVSLFGAGEAKIGELRVGLTASPSQGTLRCVIEGCLIGHPGVRLSFAEAERGELLSLLGHRGGDVIITTGTNSLAIGDTMVLDEERIYPAVSSNSHLAVKTRLNWTDVEDQTYLVSTREAGQDIHNHILRRTSGLVINWSGDRDLSDPKVIRDAGEAVTQNVRGHVASGVFLNSLFQRRGKFPTALSTPLPGKIYVSARRFRSVSRCSTTGNPTGRTEEPSLLSIGRRQLPSRSTSPIEDL